MTGIKQKQFTLTELLVILCVVVIVIVMIPLFYGAREKARRINCTSHLKELGLAFRMYSQENKLEFPSKTGRAGFESMRIADYIESVDMYICPSTNDKIPSGSDLRTSSVSYMYACGMNEATSVDSAIVRDRDMNHNKYGNALFVDGHAQGFAGANWTSSAGYLGSSIFSY